MTSARTVVFEGKQWPLPDLARAHGLHPKTLHARIFNYRMSIVAAVTTPVGEHKRRARGRMKVGIASRRCPNNAHWAVRRLFEIVEDEQAPLSFLAGRAGVTRETIGLWRYKGNPGLLNIEACLNALGYEFKICPVVSHA